MSITMSFAGNNCNNMFQYALLRRIADRNGYEFYVPQEAKERLLRFFPNLYMGCDTFEEKQSYYEKHEQPYDPEIFNIKDGTYIHGFFQTDKYFKGFENTIKQWLYIEPLVIEPDTCYIHLRGKDYYKGWPYLPVQYYTASMQVVRTLNPKVKFKIITDDVKAAEEYFSPAEIISGNDVFDFTLMMSADYLIIANSSYSYMAAWLNDKAKMIIAPSRWFNYNKNYEHAGLGKGPEHKEEWYPIDIKTDKFTWIE
jgi:hypothetical protein